MIIYVIINCTVVRHSCWQRHCNIGSVYMRIGAYRNWRSRTCDLWIFIINRRECYGAFSRTSVVIVNRQSNIIGMASAIACDSCLVGMSVNSSCSGPRICIRCCCSRNERTKLIVAATCYWAGVVCWSCYRCRQCLGYVNRNC